MVKHIAVFSCEPGGAEVLIPAVQLLARQPDWRVTTLAYSHGLDRFRAKSIPCEEIGPVARGDLSCLTGLQPDLILTSATSLPDQDMSDRHLWLGAHDMGIASMAFLDQWQNYGIRFSGTTSESRLAFLPDIINCLDAVGRAEMLAEGFDPTRLRAFGHPGLSSLPSKMQAVDVAALRARLGLGAEQSLAMFVSEPIAEFFGDSRGYTQYEALDLFFDLLEQQRSNDRPLIKLHPKDNRSQYEQITRRYADFHPLLISAEVNPTECLALASIVYGMTSIMLIEAHVLGLPVVSLQPGLVGQDLLVLSRLRLIPVIIKDQIVPPQPSGELSWIFQENAFLACVRDLMA